MKIKHRFIMYFRRVVWYIEGVYKAVAFYKAVDNYKFLEKTKYALEMKLLELKRKEKETEAIVRIETQIDLIKKILNYVSK